MKVGNASCVDWNDLFTVGLESMLEPNPELSTFDTPLEESHSRSAECADPPRTCSHRGENDDEEIKPKWGS